MTTPRGLPDVGPSVGYVEHREGDALFFDKTPERGTHQPTPDIPRVQDVRWSEEVPERVLFEGRGPMDNLLRCDDDGSAFVSSATGRWMWRRTGGALHHEHEYIVDPSGVGTLTHVATDFAPLASDVPWAKVHDGKMPAPRMVRAERQTGGEVICAWRSGAVYQYYGAPAAFELIAARYTHKSGDGGRERRGAG